MPLSLSLSQSLSPLYLNISDPRLCRPQRHRQAPSCRSTPPTHASAHSSISTLTQCRQAWVSLDFVGFIVDPSSRFLWVSSSKPPLPSSAHYFGFPSIQALSYLFLLLLFFFFLHCVNLIVVVWVLPGGSGGCGLG